MPTVSTLWLPLTPRAVAAFARAPLRRLLLVQFIVALAFALVFGWFLYERWFPIIGTAIGELPPQGSIRSRKLDWQGTSPLVLAEGKFLALNVDLNHSAGVRSPAHVQVEFGKTDLRFRSLFGTWTTEYPSGWIISANRTELKPLWGAWEPFLLAAAVTIVTMGLLLTWWLLALLYALPVRITAFFWERDMTFFGSTKLCGAGLLPGGMTMIFGATIYGAGLIDLIGLLFLFGAHFLAGIGYIIIGLISDPKADNTVRRRNPFAK